MEGVIKGRVHYKDGTTAEFMAGLWEQIAADRAGETSGREWLARCVAASFDKPFEEWAPGVLSIEVLDDPESPTQPSD